MKILCSKYLKEHLFFFIYDIAKHYANFEGQILSRDKGTKFQIILPIFKRVGVIDRTIQVLIQYLSYQWPWPDFCENRMRKNNVIFSEQKKSVKISAKFERIILSVSLNVVQGNPFERITLNSMSSYRLPEKCLISRKLKNCKIWFMLVIRASVVPKRRQFIFKKMLKNRVILGHWWLKLWAVEFGICCSTVYEKIAAPLNTLSSVFNIYNNGPHTHPASL